MADAELGKEEATFSLDLEGEVRKYDAFDLAIKFEENVLKFENAGVKEQIEAIKSAFEWPELTTGQAMAAAGYFMRWMKNVEKKIPWMQSFGPSTASEEGPEQAETTEPVT